MGGSSNVSGCCVGAVSLRGGVQSFAFLNILYTTNFIFLEPSWWTWPISFGTISNSCLGLLGVCCNSPRMVRAYLYLYLLFCMGGYILEEIRFKYDKEGVVEDLCSFTTRKDECVAYHMSRTHARVMVLAILSLVYILWVYVVTQSFIQVLEMGGNGTEFMSPYEMKQRSDRELAHQITVADIDGRQPTILGTAVDPSTITEDPYEGVQATTVVVGFPVKAEPDPNRSSRRFSFAPAVLVPPPAVPSTPAPVATLPAETPARQSADSD